MARAVLLKHNGLKSLMFAWWWAGFWSGRLA